MRSLIIGLSILCLVLSGIITFKALSLSEKDPLNPTALSQVKSQKSSHVVKEISIQPAIEQAPLNSPVETSQKSSHVAKGISTQPAIEQAPLNSPVETSQNTISQPEQKLIDKNKAFQTDTQSAKNTSQNILKIDKPENTEKHLGQLLFSAGFKPGKFVIDDNTINLIQQSAQHILSLPPNYHVIVEGHTDNLPVKTITGKTYPKGNKNLSLKRAKAIASILEKEGLPSKRISAIGYGLDRPIASNDTLEGRSKNRRVVVRLITPEN